jgi:hypothetical protein
MERRTFLGTCAAFLGLPWLAPARPVRSKPYIEEGRPEYEEPEGMLCFGHGGSAAYERHNRKHGLSCPRCDRCGPPLACEVCGSPAVVFAMEVYSRMGSGGRIIREPAQIVHGYCAAHERSPTEIDITSWEGR